MSPELVGQANHFCEAPPTKKCRVAVVGDVALDRFVFGSVDRVSPEAPVPVLLIERTLDKPGCAANVAWNLGTLMQGLEGLSIQIAGVIGNDSAGQVLEEKLSAMGARAKLYFLKDPSRPTTLKTRFLANNQQQLLRVDTEQALGLEPSVALNFDRAVEKLLSDCDYLVIEDYAKGVFSGPRLKKILARARELGIPSLVDPNRDTPAESYTGASLITPNVPEAEAFLNLNLHKGRDDAEMAEACLQLKKKMQLDQVMITRGGHGITLLDRSNKIAHFPALARLVFDVTGAGDTVVAVLAASLAAGASLEVACVLATAAASVVVAKVGTATATWAEIRSELGSFQIIT